MWAPHERTRVLVSEVDCEGPVGEAILESHTRMHGRGKTAATLASVAQATLLPARWCCVLFFFFFFSDSRWPDSGQFALNRADSRRLGLYQSVLGEAADSG